LASYLRLGDNVTLYVALGRSIVFVSPCGFQSSYLGTLLAFRRLLQSLDGRDDVMDRFRQFLLVDGCGEPMSEARRYTNRLSIKFQR
jgi:hypothetical protein